MELSQHRGVKFNTRVFLQCCDYRCGPVDISLWFSVSETFGYGIHIHSRFYPTPYAPPHALHVNTHTMKGWPPPQQRPTPLNASISHSIYIGRSIHKFCFINVKFRFVCFVNMTFLSSLIFQRNLLSSFSWNQLRSTALYQFRWKTVNTSGHLDLTVILRVWFWLVLGILNCRCRR